MQIKSENNKIHQEIEDFFDSAIATKEDLKKVDNGYICQKCRQKENPQKIEWKFW